MIKTRIFADTRAADAIARRLDRQAERGALDLADRAAIAVKDAIRSDMAASGLGRLGMALGSGSDRRKTNAVHRRSGGGWSASGWVYIRSKSQRSVGAIISYTEGANIQPRRGRWLWIPTDDVRRLVGVPLPSSGGNSKARIRLEPRYWDRTYGRKFGPLVRLKADNGNPILVVKNATVSLSGKAGSLKPRTKTGKVPKGQVAQDMTVAFIGIPNTQRAARIDARAIAQRVVNQQSKGLEIA